MADDTTTVFLEASPLVTFDAAGLRSDIVPQSIFEPNYVLRSDPRTLLTAASTALAISGDVWRIMLAAPSAMPDYTFYPIALTASFAGMAINSSFWDQDALYSVIAPVGPNPLVHAWRSFRLDNIRRVFNGGVTVGYQTAAPVFQSFPPSPVSAIETAISAIGGLQFIVGTFGAGDKAAINLSIDARWLAFPVSVTRNAGFYVPRLFFKTN